MLGWLRKTAAEAELIDPPHRTQAQQDAIMNLPAALKAASYTPRLRGETRCTVLLRKPPQPPGKPVNESSRRTA